MIISILASPVASKDKDYRVLQGQGDNKMSKGYVSISQFLVPLSRVIRHSSEVLISPSNYTNRSDFYTVVEDQPVKPEPSCSLNLKLISPFNPNEAQRLWSFYLAFLMLLAITSFLL